MSKAEQPQLPTELTDLVLAVAKGARDASQALYEHLLQIHDAVLDQEDEQC